ncbi:FAD-binding protein [Phytoactinopolyspora halotolerans]|uniref:FAD-binding protein n=1 Tax=Phytoactinopolyspora halotolerans TaxID=1981512 RepID=A0A6L9S3W1_9ACTN|nr:FAD-binding protein [Phytoactinopolyspora halotolerans]NED98659.1 FAD-binding protein [Phytoactinopolyspora halotolerans]
MSQRPTNWAGNLTFHVEHVQRPASIEELRKLVARSSRMRVLGSGHSFNSIADTDGDLVSLSDLPGDVAVNAHTASVTVPAGVRYGELSQQLHAAGYALHNLGSLPHISVAGSCATATHGSGPTNGNLATAVSSVDIVTTDGDLVTVGADDDGFSGTVVALGALGVVVGMTLSIEPTYQVQQIVYDDLPVDALDDHLDEILSGAYSVSLFTRWQASSIDHIWVKHRTDHDEWSGGPSWFGATRAEEQRHPLPGMPPEYCTQQLGVAGPWHERLPHFRLDFTPSAGEELQSEYFVARSDALAAIRALDRIRQRFAPVLQVSEIRTIAADGIWLSPCYQRDMVGFHFTWIKDAAAVQAVLPEIEHALAEFDVVPHWGKVFTMPPEAVRSRYPRLDDFRDLARSYDPAGVFRNEFVDRYIFSD